jgi:hypothetical protein
VYLLAKQKKEDETLVRMLYCIGKNADISSYKIARLTGIARNVVVRKIKQHALINEGILTQKETSTGKRKADLLSITFKGIIYALNIGAILPKAAATVRLRSAAEVSIMTDPMKRRVFEPSELFDKQLLELIPRSRLLELEKLKVGLESEFENLNFQVEEIMKRAKKNNHVVRIFSMIEEKFSERIYTELLKRVNINPSYYDENYARYVFQSEYQKCFMESFTRLLEGDKDAIEEMVQCLIDPYSREVLQKAYFPFWAKFIPDKATAKALKDFSELKPEELKNTLRSFSKAISKVKKIMKRA